MFSVIMTEIIEYLYEKAREVRALAVIVPEVAGELSSIAAELERKAAELERHR